MKALVCGGRDYADEALLFAVLDGLNPDVVIHGAARGADLLAEKWAKSRERDYRGYPARWRTDGRRAAGPRRNRRMFIAEHVGLDLVVAFPGGAGTGDMVGVAEAGGVRVIRVGW